MVSVALAFARLRWRLFQGAIRLGGADQVGAIVSAVASTIVGFGAGLFLLVAGRSADRVDEVAVIATSAIVLVVVGFGIVAGVSQPVDPRVIAAEPLADRERVAGLLASTAASPPGLAGVLLGVGMAAGMMRAPSSLPVVTAAVVAWLLALLLVARTATNLLALLAARFPRAGQFVVGVTGLVFYGLFQFIPVVLRGLDDGQRTQLADALRYTPPGQLGQAMATAGESTGRALLHLGAGTVWLPLLVGAFSWSTRRLSHAVRLAGGVNTSDATASPVGQLVRRLCGDGPGGAIAWRSILTRFRTPRTALETVTGAGVGLGAVLVPTLLRDSPGSEAVLVGGAVQLAVLFMAGNSFGVDGPAVTHELLAGADATTMVRGKARGIIIVAAPLVVIGPLLAAAVTGEWRYLLAGFGVGLGGLFAGTGAALVQSALVPIAIPESDNPFASGESGKGLLAALLLGVVLIGLAIATVPVALALFWATDRGRVGLVTLFGGLTVVVGYGVLQVGARIATGRLRGRDPEFVSAVTPTR
jgi:ABC-2 type transport system permease protein